MSSLTNHGVPLRVNAGYANEPELHQSHLAGAEASIFTPADILGPYFLPGSPLLKDLTATPDPVFMKAAADKLDPNNPVAEHLNPVKVGAQMGKAINPTLTPVPVIKITGVVTDKKGKPLEGVKLDFWQANTLGTYSGFAELHTEGQNWLRGHQFTDADGRYELTTLRPGRYKIDETQERCAHIHVQVKPLAGPLFTTQLYFRDDPVNKTDKWERANDPLLLLKPVAGKEHEYEFNFTVKTFH